MSERLEYNQGDLPEMKLQLPSGEFRATPENTTLFTFLGRLACYDHIFLQTGDEDERTITGTYVFNQHSVFEEMAAFVVEHDYPMVLNRIEVPDCDLNAFNSMIHQNTNDIDHVPDDWSL